MKKINNIVKDWQKDPAIEVRMLTEIYHIRFDEGLNADLRESQENIAYKGLERFNKIRDTRPQDVKAFNSQVKDQYRKRYHTKSYTDFIEIEDDDIQTVDIHTTVRTFEAKIPSYQNKFREDGIGEGVLNFKKQPTELGAVDASQMADSSYGDIDGQGPLENAKILYVQKDYAETQLDKSIELRTWNGPKVLDSTTQKVMDLFVNPGDPAKRFEEGHAAYYAMVATPTGNGKWYLAEHHHENMKVSAVELEITSDDQYNTKYHFADKTNNESS